MPYIWIDNPGAPYTLGCASSKNSNRLRYHITFFPTEAGTVESVAVKNLNQQIAPKDAAPFVGEPFYPHLATLLVHEEVPNGLKKRLAKYRELRDQSAADIKKQIDQTAHLSPAESEKAWTEFNSRNATTWNKLEKERGAIWARLQHGGTWTPGVELDDILELARSIHEDDITVDMVPLRVLQYFGPGLSFAQRDLLGQMVIELPRPAAEGLIDSSLLISATGERLPLPTEASESVKTALTSYKATKKQIQDELLYTLLPYVQQSYWGSEKFVRKARRLQQTQAPHFEQLDQQFNTLVLTLQQEQNSSDNENFKLPDSSSTLDLNSLVVLSAPQRRLLAATAQGY